MVVEIKHGQVAQLVECLCSFWVSQSHGFDPWSCNNFVHFNFGSKCCKNQCVLIYSQNRSASSARNDVNERSGTRIDVMRCTGQGTVGKNTKNRYLHSFLTCLKQNFAGHFIYI